MNQKQPPNSKLTVSPSRRGNPIYRAKWRDRTGQQCSLTIGPAWLVRQGDSWVSRLGRPDPGSFDEPRAYARMAELVAWHDQSIQDAQAALPHVGFEAIAETWLASLARNGQLKPSTLRQYRWVLTQPLRFAEAASLRLRAGKERS